MAAGVIAGVGLTMMWVGWTYGTGPKPPEVGERHGYGEEHVVDRTDHLACTRQASFPILGYFIKSEGRSPVSFFGFFSPFSSLLHDATATLVLHCTGSLHYSMSLTSTSIARHHVLTVRIPNNIDGPL